MLYTFIKKYEIYSLMKLNIKEIKYEEINFVFLFKCFHFSHFFSFSYILSSYTPYSYFLLSLLFIFLRFSFLILLIPFFCLFNSFRDYLYRETFILLSTFFFSCSFISSVVSSNSVFFPLHFLPFLINLVLSATNGTRITLYKLSACWKVY
jgi:hypothetical protein